MKRVIMSIVICLFSVSGLTAAEMGTIDVHGFVSQGYLYSDENNFLADSEGGTTEFNEIGINFSSDVTDRLRIGLQFLSRDLGEIDNNEVRLEWAFMDYNYKEWMGFRAGRIKMPYGLYNESKDIDAARTFILLPQSLYPDVSRDINTAANGFGIYGDFSSDAWGSLEYQLLFGKVDSDTDSGGGSDRITTLMTNLSNIDSIEDLDVDFTYLGSLKWHTPLEGLTVGYSGFKNKMEMDATIKLDMPMVIAGFDAMGAPITVPGSPLDPAFIGYYFDYPVGLNLELSSIIQHVWSIEYIIGELTLASEFRTAEVEQTLKYSDGSLVLDPSTGQPAMDDVKQDNTAWYVSASYRVNDWLEVGAYYSEMVYDDDDKDGDNHPSGIKSNGYQDETVLSFRFDLNEYWILKLEAHKMDGTFFARPNDDGTYEQDDWYTYAAKITASF